MKTSTLHVAVLSIIIIIVNTSCIHYYYAPGANNVPLFKEKNEARVQAQYSEVGVSADDGDAIGGFELQTAYAAGNHFGLQLNYFHVNHEESGYGSGIGNYIEAAAGYFKPSANKRWIFESYGGIGNGTVKSIYTIDDIHETATTAFTKFFVQPSFGYSSKHFAAAFSSKISLVNFGVRNSSLTQSHNPDDYSHMESLKNGKSYVWWEPGLLIRGGFKHLQAFMQVTYSIQGQETLPFLNSNYSIGVTVPFSIKSKQRQ